MLNKCLLIYSHALSRSSKRCFPSMTLQVASWRSLSVVLPHQYFPSPIPWLVFTVKLFLQLSASNVYHHSSSSSQLHKRWQTSLFSAAQSVVPQESSSSEVCTMAVENISMFLCLGQRYLVYYSATTVDSTLDFSPAQCFLPTSSLMEASQQLGTHHPVSSSNRVSIFNSQTRWGWI